MLDPLEKAEVQEYLNVSDEYIVSIFRVEEYEPEGGGDQPS
jgi:hypothetical protein